MNDAIVPLEPADLVAAKLEYLLRDFGPVRNDEHASYIVRLAIVALSTPTESECAACSSPARGARYCSAYCAESDGVAVPKEQETTTLGNYSATARGFPMIEFNDSYDLPCKLQCSSAIEDTQRGFELPGSSYVWLGPVNKDCMHLSREKVLALADELSYWLTHGDFNPAAAPRADTP